MREKIGRTKQETFQRQGKAPEAKNDKESEKLMSVVYFWRSRSTQVHRRRKRDRDRTNSAPVSIRLFEGSSSSNLEALDACFLAPKLCPGWIWAQMTSYLSTTSPQGLFNTDNVLANKCKLFHLSSAVMKYFWSMILVIITFFRECEPCNMSE